MERAAHILSDKIPGNEDFDYETYWKERIDNDQAGISYPEIVAMCAHIMPTDAHVLDIGCGSGLFLQELCKRKRLRAVGVDLSLRAVEAAKSRGVNAVAVEAEAEDLSVLGRFDFVTVFEVLEHMHLPERLLANLRRWFPHATVIASVPNTGYLASRLRLLCGRFPRQWVLHPAEHIRFWTLHDFRLMASMLGYKIVRIIPLRGPALLASWFPSLFAEALVFQMRATVNEELDPSTAASRWLC